MRRISDKLLTPAEVGDLLGFKPRTITRWCREGKFKEARKVGRVWRLSGMEIKSILQSQKRYVGN